METGELVEYEYSLPKGEEIRHYEARVVPSGPDETLAIVRDVTARVLAQEALGQSEERYRTLTQAAPDAIAVTQDGRVVYINPAGAAMLGAASPDEIIGRPAASFFPPDDREALQARLRQALEEGETPLTEERLLRVDGSVVDVEAASVRTTWDGAPAAQSILRDISARLRAEEDLRKSQADLARAQSIAHIGNWEWDVATGQVVWSDELHRILGLSPQEISFELVRSLIHPDVLAGWEGALQAALSEDEPFDIDLRMLRSDGAIRWVHTEAQVERDEEGNPLRMFGTAQDITAQKEAELALVAEKDRAQHFLDITPSMILALDREGTITLLNEAGARILECDREWAIGRNWFSEFLPASHHQEVGEVFRQIMAGQRQGQLEHENPVVTAEGNERLIHWRNSMLYGEKGEIIGVLSSGEDITERRATESALLESQRQLATLMAHLPGMAYRCANSRDRSMEYVSPGCQPLTGYEPEDLVHDAKIAWGQIIHPEDRERVWSQVTGAVQVGRPFELEYRIVTAMNETALVWEQGSGIRGPDGQVRFLEGYIVNVTERRRLEEQLRQALKMEAIGRLAGGVAHDFNNLLTAITSYTDILLEGPAGRDTEARSDLQAIQHAAGQAASLTSQLLAFSRRQVLQPRVLDLNRILADTERMLTRLIGEDIVLTTTLASDPSPVHADPGQLSQIIMNLAVNARDAMPQGGKLTIETANVDLDEGYASQHFDVKPGRYVLLAMTDTGMGMDTETQEHLFEPFYTTKEVGKGTGLGLATVYGIVKSTGGHVEVYSEEGIGTIFKVYLPRASATVEQAPAQPLETPPGNETVLLVEDNEMVRSLTRRMLEGSGYHVLTAGSPAEALETSAAYQDPIHLLLTDVIMPGMSGSTLAARMIELRPEIGVLFMSGYTDDAVVSHGVLSRALSFIQKPFSPSALARKVREVLDMTE